MIFDYSDADVAEAVARVKYHEDEAKKAKVDLHSVKLALAAQRGACPKCGDGLVTFVNERKHLIPCPRCGKDWKSR
jgi:hypothetical protein